MNPYTDLTEALEGLICQGYNINFTPEKDFIDARDHNYKVDYNEMEVRHAYHFSDPDPKLDAIIYGVSSKDHVIKGLMIISSIVLENGSQEIKNKFKQ